MRRATSFYIAFIIVLLDQASKYIVRHAIEPSGAVKVFPFLYLVNIRNRGAAFGLFKNLGNSFFIVLSVAALIVVCVLLSRRGIHLPGRLGLTLILGGAGGNLVDRVLFGSVVDFIDVFVGRYHWPAFNVADSAITVGLFLLLFSTEFKKRRPE
jgi:signal peptidase II